MRKKKNINALSILLGHEGSKSDSTVGERLGGALTSPLFLGSLGLLFGGKDQIPLAFQGIQMGLGLGDQRRAAQEKEAELQRQEQLRQQLAGIVQPPQPAPVPGAAGGAGGPPPVDMAMAGGPAPGQMMPPQVGGGMATPPPQPAPGPPGAPGGQQSPGTPPPSLLNQVGQMDDDTLRQIAAAMLTRGNQSQQTQGLSIFQSLQEQGVSQTEAAKRREFQKQEKAMDREFAIAGREDEQQFKTEAAKQAQAFSLRRDALQGKRQMTLEALRLGAQQNMAREKAQRDLRRTQTKTSNELIDQETPLLRAEKRIQDLVDITEQTTNQPLYTPLMEKAERYIPGFSDASGSGGRYRSLANTLGETVLGMMDVLRGLGQMSNKELAALERAAPTLGDTDNVTYDFAARSMQSLALSYERLAQKAQDSGRTDLRDYYMGMVEDADKKARNYLRLRGKR